MEKLKLVGTEQDVQKKKNLKSPQWIRNLKTNKRYNFYKINKKYFSKNYEDSFKIIENGGWHFT